MKQIIIATKNQGKAKEFKQFFAPYNINAISLLEMSNEISDVEETGTTFIENAIIKAEAMRDLLQQPILADDSGLEIDALDGRPGVYSARYAGEEKNDQANIDKVLQELEGIPLQKRTARFVCVLAIARPGEDTIYRTGYCEGLIGLTQKGENGFGYDPIFIPSGYSSTMAQLSSVDKNKISHRSNALKQLEKWLKNLVID